MNPIREAASRVKGHWHQGNYHDSRGNACGLGHLHDVVEEMCGTTQALYDQWDEWNEQGKSPAKIMASVAQELYPDRMQRGGSPFPTFNDHPDTTEDDVIAVMEKAAVRFDELI